MSREPEAAREITLFLGLTLLFSAAVYVPIIRAGAGDRPGSSLEGLLMLAPGLAAIVTYLACEHALRPVGWKLGRPRYLLLGLVLPIVYCFVEYGLVWLTGRGGYNGKLTPGFAESLLLLILPGTFSALLEEIGWRGLLVPKLMPLHGFTVTSILSGLIWAVWHYPLIIVSNPSRSGSPLIFSLFCFTLFTVGLSFAAAWLRLASGGVWAAALLHGSHNVFMLHGFNPLVTDTGGTWLLVGERGALTAAVGIALAVVFWRLRFALPGRPGVTAAG